MSIPTAGTAVTVGSTNTSTDLVQSFTTGVGQTYLLVGVGCRNKTENVGTLTFGATSLSLIKRQGGSIGNECEIWGAVVPASTTANVTVHWNVGGNNATVSIVAYTGVDTTNPIGAGFSAFISSDGTLQIDVTDSTSYSLVECRQAGGDSDAATIGVGQTQDFAAFTDAAFQCTQRGSRKNGTGGTVNMQYTSVVTANADSILVAVAIRGFQDRALFGACTW